MDTEIKAVVLPELPDRDRALHRVANAVHRMNEAIQRAVSVELVRVARHHDGVGNWGDQMVPLVRETAGPSTA